MSGLNEARSFNDLMKVVVAALIEADDLLDSAAESEKRYMYDASYHYAVEVRARQIIYRLQKMP